MNCRTFVVAGVGAVLGVVLTSTAASAAPDVTWHTGSGAPALAAAGGRLYVAWAGTSGTSQAKELVLGWSTSLGHTIAKVGTNEVTAQNEGPALVADPDSNGVVLAWADGRTNRTLTIARYDGSAFTCRTAITGVVAAHAPALATDSSGKAYVAWTDPQRHLNVARIPDGGCAISGRATLAETSDYGPGLIFDSTGRTHLGLVLGWVDGNGLNLASWGGATTLTNRGVVTSTTAPGSAPALWISQDDISIMFRGTDGFAYFAAAGGCTPVCTYAGNTGVQVSSPIGADARGVRYAYFNPAGRLTFDGI